MPQSTLKKPHENLCFGWPAKSAQYANLIAVVATALFLMTALLYSSAEESRFFSVLMAWMAIGALLGMNTATDVLWPRFRFALSWLVFTAGAALLLTR